MKNPINLPPRVFPAIAAALLLGANSVLAQVIFVDFEPTDPATYVADQSINGVDSWVYLETGSSLRVAPTAGGYPNIGPGTQSFWHGSTARIARPFTTPTLMADGFRMSWLLFQEGTSTTVNNHQGLGSNLSSGMVPIAGIGVTYDSIASEQRFQLIGDGSPTVTSLIAQGGSVGSISVWELEIELSLTNQQFNAYATLITFNGNPVANPVTHFLGTKDFGVALAGGMTTNTGNPATTGPVFYSQRVAGNTFVIDNIIYYPIPEPGVAGMVLAAIGGWVFLRRRRG